MTLDFLLSHFSWLGPWFFFFIATAEAVPFIGTFLPGATIVTLGGFASAHGYFSLPAVLIFSIIGAITGDAIGYYTGIKGGKLIRRKRLINEKLLEKGERFFNKYGNSSLLWGRFIGPIRSIMPFLVGALKVKQKTFWIWNIVSGITWGIFYVLFGYFSGNLFSIIVKHWSYELTWLLLIIAVLLIILWFLKYQIKDLAFVKKLEERYPFLKDFFISKS